MQQERQGEPRAQLLAAQSLPEVIFPSSSPSHSPVSACNKAPWLLMAKPIIRSGEQQWHPGAPTARQGRAQHQFPISMLVMWAWCWPRSEGVPPRSAAPPDEGCNGAARRKQEKGIFSSGSPPISQCTAGQGPQGVWTRPVHGGGCREQTLVPS